VQTYIIRRVLINIPVIWLVATLVFFATSVLPGDFVLQRLTSNDSVENATPDQRIKHLADVRKELGLADPVGVRYLKYLGRLVRGDFGTSFANGQPALEPFRDGIPYTLQLGLMTFFVAIVTSVPIGVLSAIRQDSWPDYVLRVFAILALAMPNFWVATMALLFIVRWSLWNVPLTTHPLLWEDPVGSIKLFGIPAVCGGLAAGAGIMRLLRSQMLEVQRQDYIRTAWAKGVRERSVVLRHALKNAMVPVLTAMGLVLSGIIGGNVVFESLFNIPGVGFKILDAIRARDIAVVQAFVIVIATFIVFVNLGIDLLYGMIDPRIHYS
jgi:peptide/nickel transport system permease protein